MSGTARLLAAMKASFAQNLWNNDRKANDFRSILTHSSSEVQRTRTHVLPVGTFTVSQIGKQLEA